MCGILGILGNSGASQELFDGLVSLQHRGQDSAGIMTYDDRFHLKKGNGLVREVFHTKNMIRLKGSMGIGHVRYPTAGSYDAAEAQPFYVNSPFGIAMIHNGNLTNYEQLKKEVMKNNIRHLNTNSDSEILANVIANEILNLRKTTLKPADIFKALEQVYARCKGSYSVIMMIAGYGLVAFRDRNGIRPLILGKRQSGKLMPEYIIASESVAVDTMGYIVDSDVQPGEAIFIDMKRNVHRKQIVKKEWAPCIFEHVYLARPDSVLDKVSVHKTRLRMGVALADQIRDAMKKGAKIDIVVPIPDSSRTAALALAEALGIPYREGLIKNRYIGRTFIMPGQEIRKKSIRYKLNPIILELRNKNVLLVDDSIVRGNTSKKIVEMVRGAGAKNVYFASTCPPLRYACVYGVDMPSKKEFIANKLSIKQIAKVINVDGLFYQELKDLRAAAHAGNPAISNFCAACMDGKYPTKEVNQKMLNQLELARELYRKNTEGSDTPSKEDKSSAGDDVSQDENLTLV
jgi:amidophosphoribosyltransferase